MPKFIPLLLALKLITFKASAQCSVVITSTNGYSVTVKVKPASIIPSTTNCQWSYNYNLVLNYTVSFSGSNIPAALYTLQGNVYCGSQSLFYSLPLGGGTGSYTTTSNPSISSDGSYLYTTHPSCTAANVSNMNCGTTDVHIGGPGINDQTVSCPQNSTLPVSLADLAAVTTGAGILLNWKTMTETNNDFFTVERSMDGANWISLEKIKGAGTSSKVQYYSFTDDNASYGLNYYRLAQTDLDGTIHYSSLVYSVNAEKDQQLCSNVWPNPAADEISFNVYAGTDGHAQYRLLNDVGMLVKAGTLDFYTGTTNINLSTEDLNTGFYLLEISFGADTKIYRKIVKI